jgi:hypothetical protein
MKNRIISFVTLVLCIFASGSGMAQLHHRGQPLVLTGDSLVRGPYSLVIVSNDTSFNPVTKQRMIDAFFNVYPKEVERFNKQSLTKVIFFIDTAYKAVAETGNGMARINPQWMKFHPEDLDVVTHEVMHVVQSYRSFDPGWLTEGIADYVRYVYGVNNKDGGWILPDYRPGQSYRNAYRVTARFLLWVEKNKYNKIVDDMDKAMRDGSYAPELWKKLTGKTVDELWSEYAQNPAIELTYK